MDIVIQELIVEEDRPEHIAKHDVTIEEVEEVISANFVYIQGKQERLLLIGKTKKERFLAIVVGKRNKPNVYGLVTARPAHKKERSFYNEIVTIQGGDQDD